MPLARPLGQDRVLNRLLRETAEGKVETAMLELRNMIGMKPEDPLRLRGDFTDLIATLPPLDVSIADALLGRPARESSLTCRLRL